MLPLNFLVDTYAAPVPRVPMRLHLLLRRAAHPPPPCVFFYNDVYRVPLPAGHRFPMEKYRLVRERLQALLSPRYARFEVSPVASVADLCLAHDPEYVRRYCEGEFTEVCVCVCVCLPSTLQLPSGVLSLWWAAPSTCLGLTVWGSLKVKAAIVGSGVDAGAEAALVGKKQHLLAKGHFSTSHLPPPPPGDRHFHVFPCAGLCCPSALHMALHCFPIASNQAPVCVL